MATNRVHRTATIPKVNPLVRIYRRVKRLVAPGHPGRNMVGWYNPKQLTRTGIEVFISTIIGRHADRRLVEAIASNLAEVYDFSDTPSVDEINLSHEKFSEREYSVAHQVCSLDRDETGQSSPLLWIDYVSDLGDGWNPTYTIAQMLSKKYLNVQLPEGGEMQLPRGEIVIFGGDEVYPTAERIEYRERLELPYIKAGADRLEVNPYIFAIPGNHDWYDSLSSFSNIFCDEFTTHFADKRWLTPQNRSYFALKLPQGWWLLGIDIQLKTDLDELQMRYFDFIARTKMQPGDRVIFCCSEPFWIYNKMYSKIDERYRESNVARLEKVILKNVNIVLYLAGDLHHYFRIYDRDENNLKITSGGGGAFLHPTHGTVARSFTNPPLNMNRDIRDRYQVKAFPNRRKSWWLGWRNFLFPFLNPSFGLVTGTVYLLASWFLIVGLDDKYLGELKKATAVGEALVATFQSAIYSPFLSFLMLAILGGFILFTEPNSRIFRNIAGVLHGLSHILLAFLIAWIGLRLFNALSLEFGRGLIAAIAIFMMGWISGSFLMGIYLFISLNILGRHTTEAFSSLAIQDWKNFIRICINKENGQLTIYPIGVKRVPRKWDYNPALDTYISNDKNSTPPELIERAIVLTPDPFYENGVEISFK